MKKIIRLTESELHGIVMNAVKRVLRESGEDQQLINAIVNGINTQWNPGYWTPGDNEIEISLGEDTTAYIDFELVCDPYKSGGARSNSYDVPDDQKEISDKPTVYITNSVVYFDGGGREQQITDNGIIQNSVQNKIDNGGVRIEYDWGSVPSEEDYFYHED
jgi:hypothetical protein